MPGYSAWYSCVLQTTPTLARVPTNVGKHQDEEESGRKRSSSSQSDTCQSSCRQNFSGIEAKCFKVGCQKVAKPSHIWMSYIWMSEETHSREFARNTLVQLIALPEVAVMTECLECCSHLCWGSWDETLLIYTPGWVFARFCRSKYFFLTRVDKDFCQSLILFFK